jgi:hypothetical protein
MGYERLTNDLFKSKEFSRNELDLFTVDLISRLKAMPSAVVSAANIALLETNYQNFKDGLGKLATEGAVQKGGTITRQDAYDDVIDFIRRHEGLVKSKFGKQSAAYLAFYPQGLTEYGEAKVEGLTNLLVRYVAAATKYKAELGADFETEIQNIQSQYINARSGQVDDMANTKSTQSQIRESRKTLTVFLTKLVLLVAAELVEKPEQFNSYFNFGLLEVDNDKTPKESTKITEPIV